MCHIPGKEFKKVGERWLTVYKVAVETKEYPFALNTDPLVGFKLTGNPVWESFFKKDFSYHTLFTGSEIILNAMMCDDMVCAYEDGENIGPGYYHFFKTREDAEKFLERVVGRCNFQKDSRPCILVGEIPTGEMYNEGMFIFEDAAFVSIVARKVYYSGAIYYEGE